MTKKNINIIITHILPLLLVIAIGIALIVGIGKATGLLAHAHLGHDTAGAAPGLAALHHAGLTRLARLDLLDAAAAHEAAAVKLGVEFRLDALGALDAGLLG